MHAVASMARNARFMRCLVVLCWLTAGCSTTFADQEVDLSGTYQGHAAAADPAKRVFTLNLAEDGTATLITLYLGKNDETMHGRWTRSGHQVLLTFDAMGQGGPPRPITFRHRDHQLSPIHWDENEWGRGGPPVLHRARPAQGGL